MCPNEDMKAWSYRDKPSHCSAIPQLPTPLNSPEFEMMSERKKTRVCFLLLDLLFDLQRNTVHLQQLLGYA